MGRRLSWLLVSTLGLAGCLRLRGEPLECYKQGDCGSGQVCRSGQCVSGAVQACPGGVCTPVATGGCSGTGCGVVECSLALKDQCVPYGCEAGVCKTSCSTSDDCSLAYDCVRSQCLKADGATCEAAGECAGANCCGDSSGLFCSSSPCPVQECATCVYPDRCESGICFSACTNKECGEVNGVACGECASGEHCTADNLCERDPCSPLGFFCSFASLMSCEGEPYGRWIDDCAGGLICVPGDSSCRTPCGAGEMRCENGVLGTCRADGTVDLASAEAQDCAAQGYDCTEQGCGTVTADPYADYGPECGETIYASAGLYLATEDLLLYRFAAPVVAFGAVTMTYRIHESVQGQGPFFQIWEGAVFLSGISGMRHLAGPPAFLPLTKDHYYLLSVERSSSWGRIQCPRSDGVGQTGPLASLRVGLELPAIDSSMTVSGFAPGVVPFDIELFTPAEVSLGMGGAGGTL
jgi:hypothetical protein